MVTDADQLPLYLIRDHALAGALHSDELAHTFVPMLRAVIAGTTWFTERIVTESSPQATGRTRLATMRSDLTLQEQELLSLLTTGYSNGQIAARMNLREQTVRNYVSRLYEKFGVSGRPQLLTALRKLVPDW